jgi:hypothetical protein
MKLPSQTLMYGITIFSCFFTLALAALWWNADTLDVSRDTLLWLRILIFMGAGLLWSIIGALWHAIEMAHRGSR